MTWSFVLNFWCMNPAVVSLLYFLLLDENVSVDANKRHAVTDICANMPPFGQRDWKSAEFYIAWRVVTLQSISLHLGMV